MTAMFEPQLFANAIADPRFAVALGIAVLAGAVRGFTGFGSALLYMPLISAIYGPRIAAATLLLIDTICSLPFAIKAIPDCNWREVRVVMITGVIGVPLGVCRAGLCRRTGAALVHRRAGAHRRRHRSPPAGAITASRRLPPRLALARSPASAPARCRSARRRCSCYWLGGPQQRRHRARQHHGLFSSCRAR